MGGKSPGGAETKLRRKKKPSHCKKSRWTRTRVTEDIPAHIQPVVTEHTIDRVVEILGYHLQTKLTPGGLIDRCRGSSALQKFFTDEFQGVLITDFRSTYGSVCAEDRQYCHSNLDQVLGGRPGGADLRSVRIASLCANASRWTKATLVGPPEKRWQRPISPRPADRGFR